MMNNSTSDTEASSSNLPPEARAATWGIVAYSFVILFSLVGNSLVIAVVYRNLNQRMRSTTNFFVAAMAVGDELMTLINTIAYVVLDARNGRLHMDVSTAAIVCKGLSFIWIFVIAWSTSCLTAIALERFFLVFYPLKSVIIMRRAQVCLPLHWLPALFWPLSFPICTQRVRTGAKWDAPMQSPAKFPCYTSRSSSVCSSSFLSYCCWSFTLQSQSNSGWDLTLETNRTGWDWTEKL